MCGMLRKPICGMNYMHWKIGIELLDLQRKTGTLDEGGTAQLALLERTSPDVDQSVRTLECP